MHDVQHSRSAPSHGVCTACACGTACVSVSCGQLMRMVSMPCLARRAAPLVPVGQGCACAEFFCPSRSCNSLVSMTQAATAASDALLCLVVLSVLISWVHLFWIEDSAPDSCESYVGPCVMGFTLLWLSDDVVEVLFFVLVWASPFMLSSSFFCAPFC